ncbi:MAG: hypothetical protein JAY66_23040, partial [Candidatus Thiodiazotropha taylori]|nr:hypothetical protein [Candidatus Thiodiazotropha taylori]
HVNFLTIYMGHSRKRRKSKASPNTTPTTSPDVEIRKVKKIKQTVKKSKLEQDKESVISSSKQTIERPIEPDQSGNNTVETLSVISEFSGRSEHSDTDQFLDADDHFNADEMQTQDNTSALETTIMDAGIPGSMDESLFSSQTPQNYQHLPPTLSQYTSTPTNVVHIPQYP